MVRWARGREEGPRDGNFGTGLISAWCESGPIEVVTKAVGASKEPFAPRCAVVLT